MINNKFIIKSLTCLIVSLAISFHVNAQQSNDVLISDSANLQEEEALVPGIFFDVEQTNSITPSSTISGDLMYKTPTANLTNTLYGLIPGLTVMQGRGEPGYDEASLTIRGLGSYSYNSYVIFIDGFQTELSYFQYLTPSEIESVTILKDAASLAPLGMKGANGAIWVTTKRGHEGKLNAQVRLRSGMQQPIKVTKPLQSYDYAMLYNEARSNDNGRVWNPLYTKDQLDAYKNGTGINTDWYDNVLKNTTPFTSADMTFSGGTSAAKYFVLLGYVGSNGVYDVENDENHANAGLKQFNIRSNFDFTIFNFIDGKVDLGGRIEERKYPGYDGSNLWSNLERYPNNIYPVMNDNDTWTGTTIHPDNPVASIRELGYVSTRDRTLQANFSLKERLDFITKGLYLSQAISFSDWTRGTYQMGKNYARYIGDAIQTDDEDVNYWISDDRGTNQWNRQQFRFTAGYDTQFGFHTIKSAIDYLQSQHNVDANQNSGAGINTKYAHQNISGRIHYGFNNKYLAEVSFAYSGSDNYKKGNRFGFYPAVSAGWVISNEDFIGNVNQINFLKLRLSVGKTGFDGFNDIRYLYEQYYAGSGSYPIGNSGNPSWRGGIADAYTSNPNIFAEQSMKYDIGVDAQFFNGLFLNADFFLDKRSGIVALDNSLMGVSGITTLYRNLGEVTTSGVELKLNYRNKVGDLNYNFGGIMSFIKDKIDYMAELAPPSPLAALTGNSIGTRTGYDAIGFYDITDFNADGTLIDGIPVPAFGQVQPGDIKYRNMNGDNRIDEADMIVIGKSDYPELVYSFFAEAEFKGFDLRVLFQGSAGRDVNIYSQAYNKIIAFQNNSNVYEVAQGRWAYYPEQNIDTRQSATYPRLSTINNNNNYRNSTLWIKDGSFLRLRNIEIGYTLPENIISKLGLSNARIFVSGVNLLTFSKLMKDYDIDPETYSGYPGIKSYNLGIAVGF